MSQIIILHLWVCLTSLYFPVQRFFAAFVILPFREKPSYKTMECVTLLLCKSCSKCSTGGRNCSISPNPYGGYCHPLPSHQTKPCALVDCWIYTRKRKRASVLFELFAYLCISWLSESVFCWVGKKCTAKSGCWKSNSSTLLNKTHSSELWRTPTVRKFVEVVWRCRGLVNIHRDKNLRGISGNFSTC